MKVSKQMEHQQLSQLAPLREQPGIGTYAPLAMSSDDMVCAIRCVGLNESIATLCLDGGVEGYLEVVLLQLRVHQVFWTQKRHSC
jgi:hypothetical protein